MPTGIFRSEDGWAQVDYGTGTTIPIPRSRYEANGYKPDFDKLPSEAEYRAAEDKKEDDAKKPYPRADSACLLAAARFRGNNRPSSSIGAIDLKKAKAARKTGKRREWTKAI